MLEKSPDEQKWFNTSAVINDDGSIGAPSARRTCSTSRMQARSRTGSRGPSPAPASWSPSWPGSTSGCRSASTCAFPSSTGASHYAGRRSSPYPRRSTPLTGNDHWDVLIKARAIENHAFVIAAAQAGTTKEGLSSYGHSIIVGPWGEVIAESTSKAEDVLVATLDLDEVAREGPRSRCSTCASRPLRAEGRRRLGRRCRSRKPTTKGKAGRGFDRRCRKPPSRRWRRGAQRAALRPRRGVAVPQRHQQLDRHERAAPAPAALMGELVVHDHRGMGESSSPEGPWSMLDYARDALGVMDELGIERFNVLGISFGGMVAQELALLVPERIRRLFLWSTSAGGGAGSSFPLDTLATMGDEERDAMALRLLDGRFDAAWLAEHPRDRRLAESRGPVPAASSTAAAAEQLEARSRHDTAERLHRLADVAVFVGAGRYDGWHHRATRKPWRY